MLIPLWAILGLGAAVLGAVMMLTQEKLKIGGFPISFWNKAAVFTLTIWPALFFGFPEQPHFYIYMAVSAVLFAISDVIFFNLIAHSGAGVVSRILPLNMIFIFFLWLLFDPALISEYLAQPFQSIGILLAICGAAVSAFMLRKCAVTLDALRRGWFVIFAVTIGSILAKLTFEGVDPQKGAFAFVSLQALMMCLIWLGHFVFIRHKKAEILFSYKFARAGFLVGMSSGVMVAAVVTGVALADNPAYISALYYLSSVFIMLYYILTGHREQANVWAGLGIVISAIALILLKSL